MAAILVLGRRRIGCGGRRCSAVLLTACLFQELCQVIQHPDVKVLKNYVKVRLDHCQAISIAVPSADGALLSLQAFFQRAKL